MYEQVVVDNLQESTGLLRVRRQTQVRLLFLHDFQQLSADQILAKFRSLFVLEDLLKKESTTITNYYKSLASNNCLSIPFVLSSRLAVRLATRHRHRHCIPRVFAFRHQAPLVLQLVEV